MNRREALAVSVASGLALTGAANAADKPPVADQPARLDDGERQRLEEGGPVVTKTFIVALRERFSDEKAADFVSSSTRATSRSTACKTARSPLGGS